MVAGANADHFGGVIAVGLTDLRLAVAVSPRTDADFCIYGNFADAAVPSDVAERASTLVTTMMGRQMLSRDTQGMDITVVSDIPLGSGLGARHSFDAALALALSSRDPEANTAPVRTRLAEVCHQAGKAGGYHVLRARHTAALRGADSSVAVIDYSDVSLTQAPHPQRSHFRVFSVAATHGTPQTTEPALIASRELYDSACANFGVNSLRQLPDAGDRVAEWVATVRDVKGADAALDPDRARSWIAYGESESSQGENVARALRSLRPQDLISTLAEPNAHPELTTPDSLLELISLRGATVVRPATPGMSDAVIAFVDAARADEFLRTLDGDGLAVVELRPGSPASTPSS
ncbi:galactokinase family protein [Corynebacterium aquatimens]